MAIPWTQDYFIKLGTGDFWAVGTGGRIIYTRDSGTSPECDVAHIEQLDTTAHVLQLDTTSHIKKLETTAHITERC